MCTTNLRKIKAGAIKSVLSEGTLPWLSFGNRNGRAGRSKTSQSETNVNWVTRKWCIQSCDDSFRCWPVWGEIYTSPRVKPSKLYTRLRYLIFSSSCRVPARLSSIGNHSQSVRVFIYQLSATVNSVRGCELQKRPFPDVFPQTAMAFLTLNTLTVQLSSLTAFPFFQCSLTPFSNTPATVQQIKRHFWGVFFFVFKVIRARVEHIFFILLFAFICVTAKIAYQLLKKKTITHILVQQLHCYPVQNMIW